jgi:hypothetical protein
MCLTVAPCTQVCGHGVAMLLNSIPNHPLTIDTMLPGYALRVGRVTSVVRQLGYELVLSQLGDAGGVKLLFPKHLSAPVLTAINELLTPGSSNSLLLQAASMTVKS